MAFIDEEPRSATVTAPAGATVLEFTRDALAGLRGASALPDGASMDANVGPGTMGARPSVRVPQRLSARRSMRPVRASRTGGTAPSAPARRTSESNSIRRRSHLHLAPCWSRHPLFPLSSSRFVSSCSNDTSINRRRTSTSNLLFDPTSSEPSQTGEASLRVFSIDFTPASASSEAYSLFLTVQKGRSDLTELAVAKGRYTPHDFERQRISAGGGHRSRSTLFRCPYLRVVQVSRPWRTRVAARGRAGPRRAAGVFQQPARQADVDERRQCLLTQAPLPPPRCGSGIARARLDLAVGGATTCAFEFSGPPTSAKRPPSCHPRVESFACSPRPPCSGAQLPTTKGSTRRTTSSALAGR